VRSTIKQYSEELMKEDISKHFHLGSVNESIASYSVIHNMSAGSNLIHNSLYGQTKYTAEQHSSNNKAIFMTSNNTKNHQTGINFRIIKGRNNKMQTEGTGSINNEKNQNKTQVNESENPSISESFINTNNFKTNMGSNKTTVNEDMKKLNITKAKSSESNFKFLLSNFLFNI
jgi:hypothetical protein